MSALDLIRLLLIVPLLTWLPGAVAWQALANGVHLEPSELILIQILTSLSITTFVATFLAELGIFSLTSLLAGLALVCLILWRLEIRDWRLEVRGWKRKIESQISNLQSLWTAGLIAILILAGVLFFRPAESFLVMDDAGVYVIHGLTLARTGGLAIHDPVLPSLTRVDATQLLPFVRYDSNYIRHEGAFHIWHWGRGLIQPSFFHLPSIWMAVLAVVAGPRAPIWATPLAGLLAIASLGLMTRWPFGPGVGLVAPLLLALSFPQTWYARYPMSEMFMQAWLLGGLFLLTIFLRQRHSFVGAIAGVMLGQLGLIRVDAWIAIVVITLCFVVWALVDRREPHPLRRLSADAWFLMPLGLTLAWTGLHSALFASGYVVSLMHLHLTPHLASVTMLGLAIVVAAMLIAWYHPTVLYRIHSRAMHFTQLASGMLLKIRQGVQPPDVPISIWAIALLVAGGAIWVANTRLSGSYVTLRWLSWYFTPLGLAAMLLGIMLMLRQGLDRPAQVVLVVALVYGLLYLPNPRTSHPAQPWGVRRLVPAVLPALVLAMAFAATRFPLPASERVRRIVQGVLVLILALVLARNLRPVLTHTEYAGAGERIEALADHLEPGAIVLFNKTGVGQAIAQPLTYLYDRQAFVLQTESPDPQIIKPLANRWIADGRPVYLAITGVAPWLTDLGVGLEPAGDMTVQFPRLKRSMTHIPREAYTVVWPIDLYRVVSEIGKEPIHRLEMGPGELPYVLSGFYEREVSPEGVTFRWTDGAARVAMPVMPDTTTLALRVSGPPAGVPPSNLTLFVDGQPVGTWKLLDRLIVLNADVPAGAAADGRLEIELRSDTWVPRQASQGDDDRRLGIVVDWIALQ